MVDELFSWAVTIFKLVTIGLAGYLAFAITIFIGGLILAPVIISIFKFCSWFKPKLGKG